jgi:hypothetical protein|tara:strand:- start:74 stop:442 length:369 start_codon:yes stop_codon:yes gene_type:complete
MKNLVILLISIFTLTSCATIVNDPNTPVSLSFSDASSGTCNLSNKRGSWSGKVPGTFSIRRSDDVLRFDCTTDEGKKGFGNIASDMEGAKLGASVLFFDLGITDAITDKHRTYSASFVIPVN